MQARIGIQSYCLLSSINTPYAKFYHVGVSRTQEKRELSPLESLNTDLIALISNYLDTTDESQEIKSLRRRFSLFGTELIQKNRILAKLAQYATK
ncbi:hypothetical protein [Legionella cardiaca]|uniref:Uncharacterized protein n=1 Tax=Legionella cardiaca TaxID=1071983 RepID=A0ABY8AT15_9GAMM|nr:hypothetical protein [Legionella cardiaca]WED43800.1 hypothetical protein PXX05_03195 [Legionella cardiaca]